MDNKNKEVVYEKTGEETKKKKFPFKKTLLFGLLPLLLILIVIYVVLRPGILKGNFDKDYLLFKTDETQEVSVEEETEDEIEDLDEYDETEPVLVWSKDFENKLQSVAISPDGQMVAVGEYLTSYIHHLSDGSLEQVMVYEHSVDDLEFSTDSKVLAGGQGVYGSVLHNVETGSEITTLHGGYNNYVAFSPDGEHIATGNREGVVWIWDLENYDKVKELEEADPTWIKSIVYHPDGNLLAVTHWGATSGNPYINIWNIEEEEIVDRIDLNVTVGSVVNLVKYSPTGNLMALADRNDEWEYFIKLLDVESGEEVLKIDIEKNQYDLDFSPDGEMIAVGVQAAPVKIYDVETGKLLYTFNQTGFEAGVSNWVNALTFTPDGKHVAVTRADNSLELWRLPGGQPIEPRPKEISQPAPLPGDVLFAPSSSELKDSAESALEELAQELKENFPNATLTFVGHTTSYSPEERNLELSTTRAKSVMTWFEQWAQFNGVEGWTLQAEGRGASELKVPDRDSEGNFLESTAAVNRRVEIEIETE
jgi:WD40 repeat protein